MPRPALSLQKTTMMMPFGDEIGYLVAVDGRLAAILVRLDAEFHGTSRFMWNLEAGFGACEMAFCDPFPALLDAVRWIAAQVGAPASHAAEAVAVAQGAGN